jgi:hypothetical protein
LLHSNPHLHLLRLRLEFHLILILKYTEGWTVGTKSNASEVTEKTFIYYGNPSLEGAARGLAQSLGYGEIKLTDKYIESSAQLTLVVGQDHLG